MRLKPGLRSREKVLALTVEYGALKLLVTQGQQVVDYRLVPVAPAFFREGLIGRPGRLAPIVADAIRELGEDPGRLIAAVPGYQTNLRLLELPKGPGLDPRVALPQQAAKLLGISLDRCVLRWHRLPDWQDRTRWVVVAVSRRSIEVLLEVLQRGALQLDALEPRPFALARCADQRDAIVAWLATDGADVLLVRDAVPVAYQSLSWEPEPIEEDAAVERITQMVERTVANAEGTATEGWLTDDVPLSVLGVPSGLEGLVGPRVAGNLGRDLVEARPPLQAPDAFPWQELAVNVGLTLREAY